jgi:hypothetical protein
MKQRTGVMGLYKTFLNEATVNRGVEVCSRAGKKTVMTLPHGIIVQEWLIAYFASSSTADECSSCMPVYWVSASQ